jgi:hypothetical protein
MFVRIYRFLNVAINSFFVYYNRWLTIKVLINITRKYSSYNSKKQLRRHRPADGVIAVLMPINMSPLRRLLVFV